MYYQSPSGRKRHLLILTDTYGASTIGLYFLSAITITSPINGWTPFAHPALVLPAWWLTTTVNVDAVVQSANVMIYLFPCTQCLAMVSALVVNADRGCVQCWHTVHVISCASYTSICSHSSYTYNKRYSFQSALLQQTSSNCMHAPVHTWHSYSWACLY